MKLTQTERETITIARSIIRDLMYGYREKELQAKPEEVCDRLSKIIGEKYNFSLGMPSKQK
jgi:hypothetical protein